MFKTFAQMLNPDEKLQFTVTRKGDQLAVLLQPVFNGAGSDKESVEIQNLRAALAMPLYVVTSPEELDRDFPKSLAEFAGKQQHGQSSLDAAMGRIKEAGKQAITETKNAAQEAGKGKDKLSPP